MLPGTRIANRYVVVGSLGAGGLGSAFRVRDLVLGGELALKIVDAERRSLETLRREFLALRACHHPRIARVHDFGFWRTEKGTRAFFTSTLVQGADLVGFARGRTWEDLERAAGDVLSALASLHRRGLLHGDVHPGNILVDARGSATLIDLSCSRPLTEQEASDVSGTAGFIAPELMRGTVHRTADLYAFGKALAESGVALPARVERVVARLSSERVEDRPQSAEEAAELLGVPWSSPPASDLLGSALVGRDAALARAREALRSVLDGSEGPRVVCVSGEHGVGRTRLLEEIKADAQLRIDAILARGMRPNAVGTLLSAALGEDVHQASAAAIVAAVERLAARREPLALLLDDADELGPPDRERLAALLRSVRPGGNLLVVVAARAPIAAPDDAVTITLEPIDEAALRQWLRGDVPESAFSAIVRATDGYPKEIAALLSQLDGAAWDSRSLERATSALGTAGRRIELEDLDDEARALLAQIVASGSLEVAPSAELDGLLRRGLVVHEHDGARLLRRSDGPRIAESLGQEAMRAAHRALAERAGAELGRAPHRDDVRAAYVIHLAHVDPNEAGRALVAAPAGSQSVALRPAADALATDALADAHLAPEVLRRCAEIYADAGEPARALALVARSLRRRPPAAERLELRELAGKCHALMGDSRRAVRVLARVLPHVSGRPAHARVAAALSLAHLKRGADAEAAAIARAALDAEGPFDPATRLDLFVNAAFATSRAGSIEEARELLARARAAAGDASPRGRFRLASATGFVEYRAGEIAAAVSAYREALEIAEQSGLDDLIASAALNYGSACHQQGDLGRALDAYARGRRLAAALGMPTTEVTLSFNIAKVYADIGCRERAALHAETARDGAKREKMALLEAGAHTIFAELATLAGDHDTAERHLAEAERLIGKSSGRDPVDLALQRAKARLAAGDLEAADRALVACATAIRSLSARDLEAAWLGVRAAVTIARGRPAEATADLERAVALANESARRGLVAELEARMAEAYAAAGSSFLADRHAMRARELWEKTIPSLPAELHDLFRRHPARAAILTRPSSAEPASAEALPVDLRRILEINRRLNSATTTSAVLEETMDAAIGLTNAERGFLLVAMPSARGQSLRVAVARNLDRETLRHGHLKYSRTVAERVVRTGEPVVAVDAAGDPRFEKARSVHAMRLKSLLCVPIRSPEGTLGAIYVDHRFSARSYGPNAIELLLALADQAALAIAKARLVDELRLKTKQLEERSAEVERLARGQALEIARLKRTIEDGEQHRHGSPRHFDYGDIVAASPAMRRVFDVLDRVIDADVTVLVRGESGTGKERIARAIHENSGRAKGPFVAINCGALPETLLEAELFGYRRGAFSGATRDHPGLFASAKGGTLFLDELGEMPPSMQVKLLRVLQEHEVRPLGSNDAVATDVRVVCATNRVLTEEVRAGRFREDLYYRIAVVEIELPPLRDRIEDVLPLADAILTRLATELGRPKPMLDRSAERALFTHSWPGNVRELENALTKAFVLSKGGALSAEDLELPGSAPAERGPSVALRARIAATLEETDYNVVLTSRILGIPRATLYRKMRRFGLSRPPRTDA